MVHYYFIAGVLWRCSCRAMEGFPSIVLSLVVISQLYMAVQAIYKYEHFMGREDALNAKILQVWYITRPTETHPDPAAHRAVK